MPSGSSAEDGRRGNLWHRGQLSVRRLGDVGNPQSAVRNPLRTPPHFVGSVIVSVFASGRLSGPESLVVPSGQRMTIFRSGRLSV